MERVEIVVEDGMLFVKWADGTLSPIHVDVYGSPVFGVLRVEEVDNGN